MWKHATQLKDRIRIYMDLKCSNLCYVWVKNRPKMKTLKAWCKFNFSARKYLKFISES